MIKKLIIYRDKQKKLTYLIGYNLKNKIEYFLKENSLDNPMLEAIFLAKIDEINTSNKTAFVKYLVDGVDAPKIGFINLRHNQKLQKGSLICCQVQWLGNSAKQVKLADSIFLSCISF